MFFGLNDEKTFLRRSNYEDTSKLYFWLQAMKQLKHILPESGSFLISPKARFFVPLLVDFSSCPSSSPLLDEEGVSVGIGGSWLIRSASSR